MRDVPRRKAGARASNRGFDLAFGIPGLQNISAWGRLVAKASNRGFDFAFGIPGLRTFFRAGRLVAKGGIEPPTHGFSIRCSTD